MKRKKNLMIDWALVPLFVLLALTGLKLHIAGHGTDHDVWHNWAVAHIVIGALFTFVSGWHIKMHWNWYKTIPKKGFGKKSQVTAAVSVAFVCTVVTGLLLLGVEGANSGIGLWHYKLGILMLLLAIIHLALRGTALLRVFKKED